jgi:hypothetical protein
LQATAQGSSGDEAQQSAAVAELMQLTAQLQLEGAGLKASLQAAQGKCSNYEQLLGRADQSITSLKADVAKLEAAVEELQVG